MEEINYDEMSKIIVDGIDSEITNQDARVVYVSKDEETKRTGDFMLGNDDKNLQDDEYLNINEYEQAVANIFENKEVKSIKMIKTGKKIQNMDELKNHIKKVKKANVICLTQNNKVKNQDARIASIKTSNMDKTKNVSGMFLGKNGLNIANGEYTTKTDLEFEIIKKKKIDIPWPKIPKSISTIAVSAGLIALLPWIMHANSTLWHHVGPQFQSILHMINKGLGTIIFANYDKASGLWTSLGDNLMNADAAIASVGTALATHGLNAAGITKIISDINSFFKSEKTKEDNLDSDGLDDEDMVGGKTL